jgi:hypothetical protein
MAALVERAGVESVGEVRAGPFVAGEHVLLVEGFSPKEGVPEILVQAFGARGLAQKRVPVGHAGERGGDAAGLVVLIAVQDDRVAF